MKMSSTVGKSSFTAMEMTAMAKPAFVKSKRKGMKNVMFGAGDYATGVGNMSTRLTKRKRISLEVDKDLFNWLSQEAKCFDVARGTLVRWVLEWAQIIERSPRCRERISQLIMGFVGEISGPIPCRRCPILCQKKTRGDSQP